MKKSFILFLIPLLSLVCFGVKAQIVNIDLNGGISGNIVIGQSNYHVSESIYLDSEIGSGVFTTAGNGITKIGFSLNSNTVATLPLTINNFKVSMKSVAAATTTLATGANNTTGYTVVFNGSITFSGLGWNTILLSTPFVRTAGQNLQVKIERSDNLANSGLVFDPSVGNYTNTAATSSRRYNGTAAITSTTSLTATNFRPAIQMIRPFPVDAEVIEFLNPYSSCYSSTQTVKVRIKNNGTTTIAAGAASVSLEVATANTFLGTVTNSAPIPTDSIAILTFTGVNMPNIGINDETAIVTVAGDANAANNSGFSSLTTTPVLSPLPQVEDVEGAFNVFAYLKSVAGSNAWTVLSFISNTGAFNNGISADSLMPRPNGGGSDFFIFDSWNQPAGTVTRLYSNCISMPVSGTSRVSFWMSHDNANAANLDSLYVVVSNDKGDTWTRIRGFQRSNSSLQQYTWSQDSVDISAFNGQTIQIGFEGVSYKGNAIGLDDINIYNGCSLGSTTTVNSCAAYTWSLNNQTYTASGTYIYSHLNNCSQNILDTLVLKIQTSGTFNSITLSSCNSYTWPLNNQTYTSSGTYIRNYNNSCGAASADTLKLTIYKSTFNSTAVAACNSYTWPANGVTYLSSGLYVYNYTNTSGCASADTLKLTINQSTYNSFTVSSCGPYTWSANGLTYTTSGTYIRTYTNGNGCSSVDTLKLTILPNTNSTTRASSCGSYLWAKNGVTYTTSGTYFINYPNCGTVDSLVLTITPRVTPTFTQIAPICQGGTFTLPTTSTNGITGTWSPAINNQTTTTYTFTPAAGACVSTTVVTITVTVKLKTSSTTNQTICSTALPYVWNGYTITTSGTYVKVFTYGNLVGCDSTATLVLSVTQATTPTFNQVAPICQGGSFVLPTISTNGISGTWSPAINNQATTTYTFTPTLGQCALTATITVSVNPTIVPIFNQVTAICRGVVFSLPTTSTNGITGTWTPAINNQTTTTYTFTPTAGQCAINTTMTVNVNTGTSTSTSQTSCGSYTWSVNGQTYTTSGTYINTLSCGNDTLKLTISSKVIPTFTQVGPLCKGDTFSLPRVSNNGITGTWSPAINNQTTTTYTFTPAAGQCAISATMTVTINFSQGSKTNVSNCGSYTWSKNGVTYTSSGNYYYYPNCGYGDTLYLTITTAQSTIPTFTQVASICKGGSFTLPTTSTNGITGSWLPAINNQTTTTYTFTPTSGQCATIATMTVIVKQPTSSSSTASVCSNALPYVWNGVSYTASGTYTKVFTGGNSVGCDSTAYLILTVASTSNSSTTVSSCNSYVWNGVTYTTSGTYTRVNNCGTDTLKLTIKKSTTSTSVVTACSNTLPYLWNGVSYFSSGSYTKVFTGGNSAGCDSTAYLSLTIRDTTIGYTQVAICRNQLPYLWNGLAYNTAGYYSKSFIGGNRDGCDSIAYLILSVKETTSSILTTSVCSNALPYVWNGVSYNSSGTYTKVFARANSVGCDSTAYLTLTVVSSSNTSTTVSSCNSYLWNGVNYTSSGIYTNSCGTDTLKLIIKKSTSSSSTASICLNAIPYVWNGLSLSTTGTYTKVFTGGNSVGCDSMASLTLTVVNLSNTFTTASSCNSYVWNGVIYTSSGTYIRSNNCGTDSLFLNIKKSTSSTTTAFVCSNALPYVWNGVSYTASGSYTKVFVGANSVGCDSAAYLALTVVITSNISTTISSCNSFAWNGVTYTTSGTYTRANSCGTDTLKLTIKKSTTSTSVLTACSNTLPYIWNGVGYYLSGSYTKVFTGGNSVGCDSTAYLTLTVRDSTKSTTQVFVCRNNLPYLWNGLIYNTPGTYSKRFIGGNRYGCDSIANLILSVKETTFSTSTASVCTNALPYVWNGVSYTSSGSYTKLFTAGNTAGCDSTAYLTLTVVNTSNTSAIISSCNSYVWNGVTYTSSGTYTRANNCGTDTLKLTIKKSTTSTTSASVCTNALPYVWNGVSYTSSGSYTKLFTAGNAAGCDSTAYLTLTVVSTSNTSTTISSCNSYTWNTITYTTSGTYTRTTSCGTDTLKLTIKRSTSSTSSVSVCSNVLPYLWNGVTYTSSGTYSKVFAGGNKVGCDSTAILVLSVKNTTSSSTSVSVCSNLIPYVWNGVSYTSSGTYTKVFAGGNKVGCDSTAYLTLLVKNTTSSRTLVSVCSSALPYVWNGSSYSTSGVYTKVFTLGNSVNCDSTAILDLTVNLSSNLIQSGIVGNKNISKCDTLQTYSVSAIAGVVYNWTVSGTGNYIRSGQGTSSIIAVIKVAGTVSVSATNSCSSTASTASLSVVKSTPSTPGAIYQKISPVLVTANTNVCLFNQTANASTGQADTFMIKSVTNAKGYLWKAPAGSVVNRINDTTIAVVFSNNLVLPDTIKVFSYSECDTSLARSLPLTQTIAATPGVMYKSFNANSTTGPTAVTSVCNLVGGGSETYMIRKIATATSYNWSLSLGTNAVITHLNPLGVNDTAIRVTYNTGFIKDTIVVKSVNGCGTSTSRVLAVSAIYAPPAVTAIVGSTTPCIGNVITYTASATVPTATQSAISIYRWTKPNYTTIISASTDSSSITLQYNTGFIGGSISAKGQSACGIAGTAKTITLQYLPPTPTGITSSTALYNACIGNVITYTAVVPVPTTAQRAASVYRWTKPNFTTITSATADSSSITVSFNVGYIGGSLTVKGQTVCGATGTAKSQALTHTACAAGTKTTTYTSVESTKFIDLKIQPNPTASYYNMNVYSNFKEVVLVKVMDMQGRVVKTMNTQPYRTITFGEELKSGIYMVEVMQGANRKTIKVVKE